MLSPLSAEMTLRSFYRAHYLPHCIEDVTSRNVESYGRALDLWEQLTPDPPLREITSATLADFKTGLQSYQFRGRPLSPNTVAKHLSHVQWILDQSGPPGPRQLRSACGLLDRVPYTRPPRRRRAYRPPVSADDLIAFYRVLDAATVPRIPDVAPGAVWQALIATIASTSLRVGQLNACPMAALDLQRRQLILPAAICCKSKAEEPHPLHPFAVERLLAIRTDRPLLFPLWAEGKAGTPRNAPRGTRERIAPHAKTTIYTELRRLQRLARVPRFGFHDIRRHTLTALSAISPAAAQLAAGHASYQTTQLYQGLDLLGDAVQQIPVFEALADSASDSPPRARA